MNKKEFHLLDKKFIKKWFDWGQYNKIEMKIKD